MVGGNGALFGPRIAPSLRFWTGWGGDSFASGLIYGLLTDADLVRSLNLGAAHRALAMPTPGDISMATVDEVLKLGGGGKAPCGPLGAGARLG